MDCGKTRCALNYNVYVVKNSRIVVTWCRNCEKAKRLKNAFCLLSKVVQKKEDVFKKLTSNTNHKTRFNGNVIDDSCIFAVGFTFRLWNKKNG